MKKIIVLLSILVLLVGAVAIASISIGREYTYKFDSDIGCTVKDVSMENEGVVYVKDVGERSITFYAGQPGETRVAILVTPDNSEEEGNTTFIINLQTTSLGTVFSRRPIDFNGKYFAVIAALVYLLVLIVATIMSLRKSMKKTMYSYKNIIYTGMIVFLGFAFLVLLACFIKVVADGGNNLMIETFILILYNNGMIMCMLLSPIVIFILLMISVSNIWLVRHEGKHISNMLGIGLGILFMLCYLALFGVYAMQFITSFNMEFFAVTQIALLFLSYLITYLNCMFLGTMIWSIAATRKKVAYDKDYVIILGCGIDKDGKPLPLLKGRVDRARRFVREQMAAKSKRCIFVPSGGQGSDEVISEAESMRNYLISKDVNPNDIIIENRSVNTLENMKFSKAIIDKRDKNAKVIFSTTNYHLFRSGMLAQSVGLNAEGIGSKTKWYFWPNAFLREFVGVICSKFKYHIVIALAFLAISISYVIYIAVI